MKRDETFMGNSGDAPGIGHNQPPGPILPTEAEIADRVLGELVERLQPTLIDMIADRVSDRLVKALTKHALQNVSATNDDDAHLNVKQTLTYLGISRSELYRRISAGEIERFNVGSYTRFTKGEVRRFAEVLRVRGLAKVEEADARRAAKQLR